MGKNSSTFLTDLVDTKLLKISRLIGRKSGFFNYLLFLVVIPCFPFKRKDLIKILVISTVFKVEILVINLFVFWSDK